ncbi:MAG: hypothetical protein IKK43_01830 [Clostridia bacterium]|nr:hypothetical protein [Clostridia bacterium]
MGKKIRVIKESDTGRNVLFEDMDTNRKMRRAEFVSQIKKGNYDDYYTRDINGIETPVSKPDGSKKNNLG